MSFSNGIHFLFVAVIAIVFSGAFVSAHVTLSPNTAVENTRTFFTVNVPHGCGTANTNKLVAIFPTSITAITLERVPYFDVSSVYGVHTSDGAQHWQAQWVSSSGTAPLPHDQIQRLGVQFITPTIASLPTNAQSKITALIYQYCDNGGNSTWTPAVTLSSAAAVTTTPPPSSSSTTAAPAGISSTTSAPHVHDSSVMGADADSWTSSDKVSVASLVICSIMLIFTLVLFSRTKGIVRIDDNKPSMSKTVSNNSPKDGIELEEKTNASNINTVSVMVQ